MCTFPHILLLTPLAQSLKPETWKSFSSFYHIQLVLRFYCFYLLFFLSLLHCITLCHHISTRLLQLSSHHSPFFQSGPFSLSSTALYSSFSKTTNLMILLPCIKPFRGASSFGKSELQSQHKALELGEAAGVEIWGGIRRMWKWGPVIQMSGLLYWHAVSFSCTEQRALSYKY